MSDNPYCDLFTSSADNFERISRDWAKHRLDRETMGMIRVLADDCRLIAKRIQEMADAEEQARLQKEADELAARSRPSAPSPAWYEALHIR